MNRNDFQQLFAKQNWGDFAHYIIKSRQAFVADYVAWATRLKKTRERVEGYQVKRIKQAYTILWGGRDCGYGIMNASDLYRWMERLPLRSLLLEAEEVRYYVSKQVA